MKTNETPGEPLIAYNPSKCIWTNGKALAKLMSEERKGHALRGFFFDYGMGESMEFKKFCPAMETAAGYMMQAARDTGKQVRVFRNMNGQIACSLATLATAERSAQ
jgi:hypothetical protein